MSERRLDPKTARHALTDHKHYRYRGCAPDPDNPRMAAADPGLPVSAWEPPDTDGGEPQADRIAREKAAKAVCGRCPVREACLAYGNSLTAEGRLAEPHAILGGTTALERHKALIEERRQQPVVAKPVPVRQLRTKQKLAVLRALAVHTDPEDVAAAAGMDVRTANWQRSILVGKLNLARDATRMQLLHAARTVGLLAGVPLVADDGSVPAIPAPPPSKPTPTATPAAATEVAPPLPNLSFDAPRRTTKPRRRRTATPRQQSQPAPAPGQLALDFDEPADDPTDDQLTVANLPAPRTPAILEAAA